MNMNLKALITTLVLGSSSMAAADSLTFSGSVAVSVGSSTHAPRPVVQPYRPTPVTVVSHNHASHANADDCGTPAPAPGYTPVPTRPVVWQQQPVQPTWKGTYFNINNTIVGATASQYKGTLGYSKVKQPLAYHRFGYVRNTGQTWFDLTEATRIDSGREFFTIGADNGMFKALKLQAMGNGSSHIQQVAIEFLDAQGRQKTQKVKLNTAIHRNNPTITIDLEGGYRSINRIVVYGSTDRGAAYKIMAM
jgi:hypothetical protein